LGKKLGLESLVAKEGLTFIVSINMDNNVRRSD